MTGADEELALFVRIDVDGEVDERRDSEVCYERDGFGATTPQSHSSVVLLELLEFGAAPTGGELIALDETFGAFNRRSDVVCWFDGASWHARSWPRFENEVLVVVCTTHVKNFETRSFERELQGICGEVRTMLVEEVPKRDFVEYPPDVGHFKEQN